MSRFSFSIAMGSALVAAGAAPAGEFANAVIQYAPGTVTGYATQSAALGLPATQDSYGYDITPFNPTWENTEMVGIGLRGSITLSFANPVPVNGGPIIGIFTNAGLNDVSWPDGQCGSVAETLAHNGYGAERSAVVEVADQSGVYQSVGRLIFAQPENAWRNSTSANSLMPAGTGVPANYFQPFTKPLSVFNGLSYGQVVAELEGSAGGTWITVPQSLGIQDVSYVRIGSPQWAFDNGSYADNSPTAGNAALYIDTVSAVPEPTSAAFVIGGAALMCLRRRTRK